MVDVFKGICFIRNVDEFFFELFKFKDLFDLNDVLLMFVFFGERKKFFGERFVVDGWFRILRKLGFRIFIEVDIMFECVKRVEFFGFECIK